MVVEEDEGWKSVVIFPFLCSISRQKIGGGLKFEGSSETAL